MHKAEIDAMFLEQSPTQSFNEANKQCHTAFLEAWKKVRRGARIVVFLHTLGVFIGVGVMCLVISTWIRFIMGTSTA